MRPRAYRTYCVAAIIWIGLTVVSRGSDHAAAPAPNDPACCSPEAGRVYRSGSVREMSATWHTDDGRPFDFSSLGQHPCVIAMFYASCEMTCPMSLQTLRDIESRLPADARADVRFILVTLDPKNDTLKALRSYRRREGLTNHRWILLHGSTHSVAQLAALLGIRYGEDTFGRRSHSTGISLLDQAGRVALQQTDLNGDLRPLVASLRAATAHAVSK